jgi:hypothetical protein
MAKWPKSQMKTLKTKIGIAGTAKWPKSTNLDSNEKIENRSTAQRQHNNTLLQVQNQIICKI